MVAIVSGNALGLSLGTLSVLGTRGLFGSAAQGRNGEGVYVNAATGNLVLQNRDDYLVSRGLDALALRTYNSQGLLDDDNGDNWSSGVFVQQLRLVGTRNTAGSTLVRTERDGAQATYAYDTATGRYTSTEGGGAHDSIAYDDATSLYVWRDGDTGLEERYESASTGRLLSSHDPLGNVLSYTYDGNLLTVVTDASGEALHFDYAGTRLAQVRTVASNGTVTTRTRYEYDTAGRLERVITDLTPEDNGVADGQTYVTTYTYDGASHRVQTLTQTDGTRLVFGYQEVGGRFVVSSVTSELDGQSQTTSFVYTSTASGTVTRVRDALGHDTYFTADLQGRLVQVEGPAIEGTPQSYSYAYNAQGDLTQVTDAMGRAVVMEYDARGNQVLQRDAAGNTVTRTYDARNQLLTETAYVLADSDGAGAGTAGRPMTTRYVYDAAGRNLLRFVVSPEGRVTEHRYNAYGERTATLEYTAVGYPVASLSQATVPTEAQVSTWAASQNLTRTQRVDMAYDFRGQLQRTTTYTLVDAAGEGVPGSSAAITQFVYDQAGRLVSTLSPLNEGSSFTYDGLGRVLSSTNALAQVTVNHYDDAQNRTSVTLANGLTTTSTYDRAGRLVSVVQSGTGVGQLGETRYFYDAGNRLLMTQDPTGVRRWFLYDAVGRKVADVDADGSVTEYHYDRNNLLVTTVSRANPVTNLSLLVDGAGHPTGATLASLGLAPHAADRRTWRFYDAANRLSLIVDAENHATRYTYDGASRVVEERRYANPVAALSGDHPALPATQNNDDADRITRKFYTADGLLASELDAQRYYTEYTYDAAGRMTNQVRYAAPMVGTITDPYTPPQVLSEGMSSGAGPYVIRQFDLSASGYFDPTGLTQRFEAFRAQDELAAITDLVNLIRNAGVALKTAGFDGVALLRRWTRAVPAGSALEATLASLGVRLDGAGNAQGELMVGDSAANSWSGSGGNDIMDGGSGADWLAGGQGDDVLDGGLGNDSLNGDAGADTYLFGYGSGADTINNADSDALGVNADTVQLGRGITPANVILSRYYDSLIIRLPGSDDRLTITSYFAQDATTAYALEYIRFADGTTWDIAAVKARVVIGTTRNDDITGYATDDDLSGGDGNDFLAGADGADSLSGGQGSDSLSGDAGDDQLSGDAGNDYLHGGTGADRLLGGTGRDVLYGGAGDDVLDGGSEDDQLNGDAGADTYLFGYGSGRDIVNNYDGDAAGTNPDTILFGAGITPTNVRLSRYSDSLVIELVGTDDGLTVTSYFSQDGNTGYAVDALHFADGTVWSVADVKARVLLPTSGNDKITGYASDDVLNGDDGADILNGAGGNDTLLGGAGRDSLQGEAGDDLLDGGAGDDGLTGGEGVDTLLGGAGNDSLNGGSGNDVLDGGSGNDQLSGDGGADTYLFGIGSGQDTVNNYDTDALGVNPDTIQLGAGLTPASVRLTRSGDSLVISVVGTDDRLTVNWYFFSDATTYYAVENIRFADGTTWSIADVKAMVLANTPANDTLTGYATGDHLTGGNGNDLLYGAGGNDTLEGGEGGDNLNGDDGDDILLGGADVDYLHGGAGNDTLLGGTGNDQLNGGSGNDSLDGGAGNDQLSGDAGADTYHFGFASGQDSINNYDSDAAGTQPDTIQLAAGVTVADVVVTRSGDDLVLTLRGSDARLRVMWYFTSDATLPYAVDTVRFADGTTWTVADVKAMALQSTAENDTLTGYSINDTISGGEGADTLYGREGNDVLDGGHGRDILQGDEGNDTLLGGANNDSLYGGSGNDILDGGTGNDTLDGGYGADTYRFGYGSGVDTIQNYDYDPIGVNADTILFGAGITTSDVVLTRAGDHLYVNLTGSPDRLVVYAYFTSDGATPYTVESLRFADDTVWTYAQVLSRVNTNTAPAGTTVQGTAGTDILVGGAGRDVLYGQGGNDTLTGGAGADQLMGDEGNDTLDGGAGDDILTGGNGNDTYLFGRGDGQDTVQSQDWTAGKVDVLRFGAGITAADVVVSRVSADLILSILGTSDRVLVSGYFTEGGAPTVDEIRFADGTVWTAIDVEPRAIAGTAGNDFISGYAGHDVLDGGAGDDQIYGNNGNDTLYGGLDDDTLYGGNGDDTLHGGAQSDTLYGDAGNDTLNGGSGVDSLRGGTGDDILDGGAGDDNLDGDSGNDTYLFGRGSGRDSVNNYDASVGSFDVVQLGGGVSPSDVRVTRESYNLVLSILGTFDQLTLSNFFIGPDYEVQEVRFQGGTVWSSATLHVMARTGAEGFNDVLTGTTGSDALDGLSGNDTIIAGDGNDVVQGGAGSDTLYGDAGNDQLSGGADSDSLQGGTGDDMLDGGDGNDTLQGGDGNDTLQGGAGDDSLTGETGNDTFLFGRGSGRDSVTSADTSTGKFDVVQLGEGVTPADVLLRRSGNDLVLTIVGTDDRLTISSFFVGRYYEIDEIRFSDGNGWKIETIRLLAATPTAGNDYLYGGSGADSMSGLDGDDILFGLEGNDVLEGGDGDDTLYGEAGHDTLRGGAQNDSLRGGQGDDVLEGGSGSDGLYGEDGNDILDGGEGNDSLDGGLGNDTFLFGRTSGKDTVNAYDYGAVKLDVIQVAAGIAPSDITLTRSGLDLVLSITGTDASMSVSNYFSSPLYQVNEIRFAGGTVWTPTAVQALASMSTDGNDTLYGTSGADSLSGGLGDDIVFGLEGNDVLEGGDGDDTLYGEAGHDTLRGGAQNDSLRGGQGDDVLEGGSGSDGLYGEDGNDVLDGGEGSDNLDGGLGNDTFLFGRTTGKDTVNAYDYGAGKLDVIQVAAGIAPSDVMLSRSGSDLVLSITGTDASMSVSNYFSSPLYQVNEIRFAGGTVWDATAIAAQVAAPAPGPSDTDPVLPMPFGITSSLLFRQVGNDLEISGIGTGQVVKVPDWYATGAAHVDLMAGNLPAPAPAPQAQPSVRDQVTRQIYDTRGQLTGQLDAERYLTEYVYDAKGKLTTTIRYSQPVTRSLVPGLTIADLRPASDPDAQSSSSVYDALDRLVRQTNVEGTVTEYVYDAVGNLVSTVKAVGQPEVRTLNARYDLQGRLTGELSAEGAALLTGSLTQEQVNAIWSQYGLTHAYDLAGRRTSTTDPYGQRTLFFYDADGRLSHTVDAEGGVQVQEYDAFNQLRRTVSMVGRLTAAQRAGLSGGLATSGFLATVAALADAAHDSTVTLGYDARGLVRTTTDGEGHATTTQYNAFGQVESTSSTANGLTLETQYEYDFRGLLVRTTRAGLETTAAYDAFGRLVESRDANGNTSQQFYDRLGRVVQTLDRSGIGRATAYDAFDRVLSQTDGLGRTTTYAYDLAARSVTVTSPEGISLVTTHTRHGQTASVRDGNENTTTYEYDLDGNLVLTTTPMTSASQAFDRAGRRIETTDARGNKVAYEYDAVGRVLSVTLDPDELAIVTQYLYDGRGQAVWTRDPNQVWTHTEYDRNGQVVAVTVDPRRGPTWQVGQPDDNASGLALRTAYTYDEAGRQLTVTDPSGTVTRYGYDVLGRRTTETVDPEGLAITRHTTYDANGNVVSVLDAAGHRTRFAYDASDRLLYAVDGAGGITENRYDAEGRVVRTIRYVEAVRPDVLAALPVAATAAQLSTLRHVAIGNDAVDARRYDADGRLRFSVDGMGAVVEYRYDDNGNVTERIAYARTIDVAAWDGSTDPAVTTDPTDRHTRSLYDALDRATFVADATGAVTENRYDGNGNVELQIRYAVPVSSLLQPSAVTPNPADRESVFVYDAANRLVRSTDATGAVTQTEYDGNGNVLTRIAFATANTFAPQAGESDRVTRLRYDAAGRLVYSQDAEGNVTTTGYDTSARSVTTRQYYTPAQAAGATPAQNNAQDRVSVVFHDAAGRVSSVRDALGATESYTYDGLGHKLSFTNKKESTWHYTYDAAGRMTSETSPDVPLATLEANTSGDLSLADTETARIVTRMAYDGLGNLLSRTEAAGRPEERVTTYRYDALGRQVGVQYPNTPTYKGGDPRDLAASAYTGTPDTPISPVPLYTQTFYDAFGDAVANRDVAGSGSYKVYDAAGRVRYTIDAEGYVTGYQTNTFGEVTTLTRYAEKTTLSDIAPTAQAHVRTSSQVQDAVGTDRSHDRVLVTTYDKLGRSASVTESAADTYDSSKGVDNGDRYDTQGKTTRNTYNVFGDLVQQAVSLNVRAGTWTYTASYYDRLGRQVADIDAGGYLTEREYDAVGNLSFVKEFAVKSAVPADGNWQVAYTTPGDDPADRATTYLYDLGNRKITEIRRVEVSDATQVASGVSGLQDVATHYGYDAVGNLVRTTDALGGNTFSYYDALGRVTAVAAPSRPGAAQGATLTPVVQFLRDAHGNVLVKIERARGASVATAHEGVAEPGNQAYLAVTADAADRYTYAKYDLHGHVLQTTDANGYSQFNAYNARGEVAKSWQTVTSGAPTYDASGRLVADSTIFKVYTYDKLGRLLHTLEPSPLGSVVSGMAKPNFVSSVPTYESDGEGNTSIHYDGLNRFDLQWTGLIDPAGGEVQVDVNYQTASTQVLVSPGGYDDYGNPYPPVYSGAAGGTLVRSSAVTTAGEASGGVSIEWHDQYATVNGGISSVNSVTVRQRVNGQWQTVWQGTPAQANGDTIVRAAQAGAGLTDTVLAYNAFGEVISKGTIDGSAESGRQEYFDYDNAGRLWRTNSGDGVDKVMFYDLQGRTTSVFTSASGNGGIDIDLKAEYVTQGLVRNLDNQLRRTDLVYDALGHVIEQHDPQRVVTEGGVSISNMSVDFSIAGGAQPTVEHTEWTDLTTVRWSGANRVNVSFPDLFALGNGDVRVTVNYHTAVYELEGATPPHSDGEGGEYPGEPAVIHPGIDTHYSWTFTSAAGIGAQMVWTDPVTGLNGGISAINSVVVEKKDAQGNWVEVIRRPSSGVFGTALEVATPRTGQAGTIELQIQDQSPPNSLWRTAGTNFGNVLRLTSLEITGAVNYQVVRHTPGQATPDVLSSGTFSAGDAPHTGTEQRNNPRPKTFMEVDRWGNVISRSDPRDADWKTTYRYNANNQVVEQTQPIVDTGMGAPVTRYFYDALGQQVGVRDANTNLNRQVFDAGGNLVEEVHADGGRVTHRYNAFGERVRTVDAVGNDESVSSALRASHVTDYAYDKMGRLTTTTHGPVRVYASAVNGEDIHVTGGAERSLVETSTYDQAGRRLTQTNGANETTQYRYDRAGNVIATIDPLGNTKEAVYDARGRKALEVDANGFAARWNYDYFGRVLQHTDLGGARITYSYDNAGQLVRQTSTRGQDISYTYDAAGQVTDIHDVSLTKHTQYVYDLAGNRVRETTTQGAFYNVYQDNHLAYDALGRLRTVEDGRMSVSIDYDAVGNRTRIRTHVNVASGANPNDQPFDTDNYYLYDAMNRQTTVDAINASGEISLERGQRFTYDKNGNRIGEFKGGVKLIETDGTQRGFYARVNDGEGGLTYVWGDGGPRVFGEADIATEPNTGQTYIRSLSGPDGEGGYSYYFVHSVVPGPDFAQTLTYTAQVGFITDTYAYDGMNRLTAILREADQVVTDGHVTTTTHNPVAVDTRLYDAGSRLVHKGLGGGVSQEYVVKMNRARDDYENATGIKVQASGLAGNTQLTTYDAAGRMASQRDYTTIHQGAEKLYGAPSQYYFRRDNATNMQYDKVGNVDVFSYEQRWDYTNTYDYANYKRFDDYKASTISGTSTELSSRSTNHQYDKNGNLISYTNAGVGRTLVNDATGQVLQSSENGAVMRHVIVNGEVIGRYALNGSAQDADFNVGYQRINGGTATGMMGSYTVRAGDTLRSIARGAYGDESRWYVIADANGLMGDGDLTAGHVLRLPSQVFGDHNSVNTTKPFDPSVITGSTTPNLAPPGPECGGAGRVIVVIVAVVVTIVVSVYSGGTASAGVMQGFGTLLSTAASGTAASAGAIGALAVGAAAGSLASQLVAVEMGYQDGVDWKSVGISAVGAAVSGGLGAGVATGAKAIMLAAVSNAVTQGVAVAIGLQDKFDWRGVAAAAAGSAVGQMVGAGVDELDKSMNGALAKAGMLNFTRNSLRGFAAGMATAAARGGRVSATQVALDAFGNAVGDSLVSSTASPHQPVIEAGSAPSTAASPEAVERRATAEAKARDFIAKNPAFKDDFEMVVRSYGGVEEAPIRATKPATERLVRTFINSEGNQAFEWENGSVTAALRLGRLEARPLDMTSEAPSRPSTGTDLLNGLFRLLKTYTDLQIGGAELLLAGGVNGVGRIVSGVVSVPALLHSRDMATQVQADVQERLTYTPRSRGAQLIGEALQPAGKYVGGKIEDLRAYSESKIGLGATAVAFGGVEAGTEIVGLLTGARGAKAVVDQVLSAGSTVGRVERLVLGEVGDASTSSVSGAASFRKPPEWGKTPQATEFLYVQNRASPLSIESALHQADDFRVFGDNFVDFKVEAKGSVLVDHGDGLSIRYRAIPDDAFDSFHKENKNALAAYRTLSHPEDKLVSWNEVFEGGVPNVHIRQSTLLSDRGAVAAFGHEYGELRHVFTTGGSGSHTLGKWGSFIEGGHERVVPQIDRLIGQMIISGGR